MLAGTQAGLWPCAEQRIVPGSLIANTWQAHREGGAVLFRRADLDRSAVRIDNLAGDVESKPEPRRLTARRIGTAPERVEDLGKHVSRNDRSVALNRQHRRDLAVLEHFQRGSRSPARCAHRPNRR